MGWPLIPIQNTRWHYAFIAKHASYIYGKASRSATCIGEHMQMQRLLICITSDWHSDSEKRGGNHLLEPGKLGLTATCALDKLLTSINQLLIKKHKYTCKKSINIQWCIFYYSRFEEKPKPIFTRERKLACIAGERRQLKSYHSQIICGRRCSWGLLLAFADFFMFSPDLSRCFVLICFRCIHSDPGVWRIRTWDDHYHYWV